MSWAITKRAATISCCVCSSAAVLFAVGCSQPEVGVVQGRVTLDGQPLSSGSVVFEDASRGISVNAAIAADGTFSARTYDKPGLPPGHYIVAIRPGSVGSGEAPLVGDADPDATPSQSEIPLRYRSVKTSELTADVELGDNPPFNFALTSQP